MVEAFFEEPGRYDQAPSIELQPESASSTDLVPEAIMSDGSSFPLFFGPTTCDSPPDFCTIQPATGHAGSEGTQCIDPVLAPLVSDLESLHNSLTTSDRTYNGTFNTALAQQVFTQSNREAFVSAYFRHTHKDVPLVHRPSFDAASSARALVLALLLCGAPYCPPRDCVLTVPRFYRIADEYIFRCLEAQLAQHLDGDEPEGDDAVARGKRERALYETLQAAVIVHGLQFLGNNAATRRRNWIVRRPAVVHAVRRLGLPAAKQTQTPTQGVDGASGLDWERFVRDETRIR